MKDTRRAPVQASKGIEYPKPGSRPGTISWEEYLKAFRMYRVNHGSMTPDLLVHRGGLDYDEVVKYLGYEPHTWERIRFDG